MRTLVNRPGGAVLATAALALAVVAGCSAQSESADAPAAGMEAPGPDTGAGDDSGAADAATQAEAVRPVARAEDGEQAGEPGAEEGGDEDAASDSSGTLPQGRMIARDATVGIEVADLARGASRVRAVAAATEGYVVQEEVRPGEEDTPGFATIVISVPTAKLDSALSQLEELGEVTGRGMTSQDVTADYVDTTARIETLEASVERVRELMARAESIADVVALESDLSRREADLDALKAHAEALAGDVSRSSVTVSLTEPVDEPEPEVRAEEGPGGFVEGLRDGWEAFTTAATAGLTAAGAALPFAGAAAVVVGPFWLARRRRDPAAGDVGQAGGDAG
jgi:Domain of unknown function (DUF4349)